MKKLIATNLMTMTVLIFAVGVGPVALAQTHTQSQAPAETKRAWNWYFGDQAGLDFSTGHPTAITNSAMSSFEGSASVSDKDGKLQFYTNGGDMPYAGGIWNRNHQLMPNGNLAGAGGCNSAFQSSLIVKRPGGQNVHYLFTTDCIENGATGGLRYSIIDMNLDGGLGDVVIKGEPLATPMDESLTAIRHANGKDYWIVSHKLHTDSFFVYHLSRNGIEGVVKTAIGYVTPDYAGALKASANGEKIVYSGLNWTSLFDFNNRTGEISNHIDLGIPSYSASFSPNCQFLYIADGIGQTLYQFDVLVYDVASTATVVGNTTSVGFGALQEGPDGRIYCARFVSSSHLGMIEYPNLRGMACSYVDNGVSLAGKIGKGGLPNYPNDVVGSCVNYPGEITPSTSYPYIHLALGRVSSDDAFVTWNGAMNGSNMFRVMYRTAGQTDWNTELVQGTNATLVDLDPATEYEVKVMELPSENYEPITNHLFDEVIARETGVEPEAKKGSNEISLTTLQEMEMSVYPNPTSGNTSINVNVGDMEDNLELNVVSATGKIVYNQMIANAAGFNQLDLELNGMPNGVYYINIKHRGHRMMKKVVLVK